MDQKRDIFKKIAYAWMRFWDQATPGRYAWRGAVWGALLVLSLIIVVISYNLFGEMPPVQLAAGSLFFMLALALVGGLLTALWRILKALPPAYVFVLSAALLVTALLSLVGLPVLFGIFAMIFGGLAAASLFGAGLAMLVRGGWKDLSRLQRGLTAMGMLVGVLGLSLGGFWILDNGSPPAMPPDAAAVSGASVEPLDLPDPSRPGPYPVRMLTYGSGQDLHRPEYGGGVELLTQPVDLSALIDGWSGLRTDYWGFGPQALPLNARVWAPEGEGPFPLVLIVHGQHPMADYSDGGYAYLGQLLASRGYIVASLDANFLNMSFYADILILNRIQDDVVPRAVLLLEHLKLWEAWNAALDNPFYGKVDMERIALIGHSRGGEAVTEAALFNHMQVFPDDGAVAFDYHFNIRSVIAIAPTDTHYNPAGRGTAIRDVSYLVLHGAHDMDVVSYLGAGQYNRVHFTQPGQAFKAGVYIYGANHGQFNTAWGRKDLFEPIMRLFNLGVLMPGEQQRHIAQVVISAFLDASLETEPGYREMFQDYRRGRDWLPDTIYLTQYQDARTQVVSHYEEDVDLSTTSSLGGRLLGSGLVLWREQLIETRFTDFDNHAVLLGWEPEAHAPSYTIQLPPLDLAEGSVLVFTLADAGPGYQPDMLPNQPIDLTIQVSDREGHTARLPLSKFSLLQPQIVRGLAKASFLSPLDPSEPIFQHFEFPLSQFVEANPALDPASLAEVRLVFDRTERGAVVLDDFGFRP